MKDKLKYNRLNIPGDAHGITFICFKKRKFLISKLACDCMCRAVNRALVVHDFDVWAYVIMPEHFHMLIFPKRESYSISNILKSIKQPVSRKIVNHLKRNNADKLRFLATVLHHHPYRFWQDGGGYDRNIRDQRELTRFVNYVHENPMRRGLVENPIDWYWSSAKEHIIGEVGPIRLNLEFFPF